MNINKLFQQKLSNNNQVKDTYIKQVPLTNAINLVGLKISLKGRLKKSARSQKVVYNYGKIKNNCLNVFTHQSNHAINTLTGISMLKINLYKNISQ